MSRIFSIDLDRIQPSQLYISSDKLEQILQKLDPADPDCLEPVPLRELAGRIVLTDGHTRAFAAYQSGIRSVPAYWDEDDLDWEAYAICIHWCQEEGIHAIADLRQRVVSAADYDRLWLQRCRQMHRDLAAKPRRNDQD